MADSTVVPVGRRDHSGNGPLVQRAPRPITAELDVAACAGPPIR